MSSERKLGKKQDKIFVLVATPAYDGKVDVNYTQSMAETAFCLPLYQIYFACMVQCGGAFIDLARNMFVKWFLEDKDAQGFTHLFFVDSDLKFEPRAFVGLLQSGRPVVAGAYRRRQDNEDYPVVLAEHPEVGGLWVDDGWIMAHRVPTGFLCIERSVLETMAAECPQLTIEGQEGTVPRLFYTKIDSRGRFVGEDFCFCDDYCARFERPIAVWPDIDFVHGKYECNYHKWLEEQIKAEEEKKEKASKDESATSSAA